MSTRVSTRRYARNVEELGWRQEERVDALMIELGTLGYRDLPMGRMSRNHGRDHGYHECDHG